MTAGLTSTEARRRLASFGENRITNKQRTGALTLFLAQFKSPIILILIGAATVSLFLQDRSDAALILAIVVASGGLGFWQEYSATNAVARLRALVETKARVLRDGVEVVIPLADVVPGDVAVLSAGAIIPGDSRLLEARELFVNEATLTGETFPTEKSVDQTNSARAQVYLGTHVVSGSGKAEITATGKSTRFGKIAESLKLRRPETEFERGVRRFGYLLAEITLLLVLAIFGFNVFLHKQVLDSFMFALALAVGLTPQLLPAIITINLSHGARRMAQEKVIVKRLAAIENFGSMNVLCSDKTGTITEGKIVIRAVVDAMGNVSEKALLYAYLNAANETGFINPIDESLRANPPAHCTGWQKLDELPYDFSRKRLSVLCKNADVRVLVTKGALPQILSICSEVEWSDGKRDRINVARNHIEEQWRRFSSEGSRVVAVAYRTCAADCSRIDRETENAMIFLGLVALSDPPKPGIESTVRELRDLGIRLKIITGDNVLIATRLAQQVGLSTEQVLSGRDIQTMSNAALTYRASEVDVFAEIEPGQKERLVLALKKAGHVVGYIGDGINDVSALHASDVSLSVDTAVDVAREAADFVLLEHDLEVLVDGVREGRRTFANTLKYVFIATSANFGNMFSMAGASLLLPFLPLLPKQILLINLLTDLPEMTIASDDVDPELIERPRRWDIHFIRRFMIVFGLISSVFDYFTFGALIWLNATVEQFRTGWFIESVISAALIVLVVRTRRPIFGSRPSRLLALATLGVVSLTVIVPYTRVAAMLGFGIVPPHFYPILVIVVVGYVISAEMAKYIFYRQRA
ncbi:MAG TPA: magnesium-translocating P-type ATPase [Candidatus Udaeobacter sp.]|jgi:Mg2+-importing ATPase|nr:magnesium-translocating P-type ATPase [Candidatus Udaeobacter sp.]